MSQLTPTWAAGGVIRVKIPVDKTPNPKMYFAPNFVAKIPAGSWVMM